MNFFTFIIITLSWTIGFAQTKSELIDVMQFYGANYGTDTIPNGFAPDVLWPTIQKSKDLICESGDKEILEEYMVMIGKTIGSADELSFYCLAETYFCQNELFISVISGLPLRNEILGSIEFGLSEILFDYPYSKQIEVLKKYRGLMNAQDSELEFLNHLHWFLDHMVNTQKLVANEFYSTTEPCQIIKYTSESTICLIEKGCGDLSMHMTQTRYYLGDGLVLVSDEHTFHNAPPYYTQEKAAAEGVTEGYFLHSLTRVETDKYYFKNGKLIAWINNEGEKEPINTEESIKKEKDWNSSINEIKTQHNKK